jgi:hypothetical protein
MRRFTTTRTLLLSAALVLAPTERLEGRQQPACPAAANALVERGYQDYGAERLEAAWAAFAEAVTNRRRFSRDRTEFAAVAYDRGVLRRGEPPDGVWELSGRTLEVRIPWGMLNVTDPSQRRVLSETVADTASTVLGTTLVPGIRVVASTRSAPTAGGADGWSLWPASGAASDVALFTWPTWEEPRWRMRQRPLYDVLRETWRALSPRVLQSSDASR